MVKEFSRRDFLASSAKITVACCALPFALQATEGLAAEASATEISLNLNAGQNAALANPGGAIYLDLPNGKHTLIVWRESESVFKAFSSACTHKGVRLNLPKDGKLVCPAHGAEFDKDGKAIKPPAKNPLTNYKCVREGDLLTISLKG
jgi:Rieske Fe-S protein